MLRKLAQIFSPNPHAARAQELYIACVQQARNPFFYDELKVPDTLDGRFDMVVLHLFLILRAIKSEPELGEALTDAFFKDMDRNLRELGVGDPGVGKRIRKMVDALYGRIAAYETTWESDEALKSAFNRNIYADKGDVRHVDVLVKYARECARMHHDAAMSLREGKSSWPSPSGR
jgi:cytochrome b pre-mRNA-processing protein 3